jgi:hypothetical protein
MYSSCLGTRLARISAMADREEPRGAEEPRDAGRGMEVDPACGRDRDQHPACSPVIPSATSRLPSTSSPRGIGAVWSSRWAPLTLCLLFVRTFQGPLSARAPVLYLT